MATTPTAQSLRAKIIGTLIRDARLAAEVEIEDCARVIGVSNEQFEAYELGAQSISLPELECVAYLLEVPIDHFWESETVTSDKGNKESPDLVQLIKIRHRMVGALLRKSRMEAGISLEALREQVQIDPSQLEAYELGLQPVPISDLETICSKLNRSIKEFQDKHGPVGEWSAKRRAVKDFMDMPLDFQTFVSRPVNRPYLELAIRLSEVSVDRLRAVAEGLLEITY